jgi:hypothetical protein
VAERLYATSERDLAGEVAEGFATLRKLPSIRAQSFASAFEESAPSIRPTLCAALLRRAHGRRLGCPVESHSPEARLLRAFDGTVVTKGSYLRAETLGSRRIIRIRGLKSLFRDGLQHTAGDVDRRWDASQEWVHVLRTPVAIIHTRFDTGGQYQLRYDHRVLRPDPETDTDLIEGSFTYYGLLGCGPMPLDIADADSGPEVLILIEEVVRKGIAALLAATGSPFSVAPH